MPKDLSNGLTRRTALKAGLATALTASPLAKPALAATKKSVRVLVVADPFYYSLREVIPQFEAETGISVALENLAYDALQARLVSSSIARKPDADVVTVDQMWTGQYLDNKWIKPLDDLIKADKSVDLKDFIPEVLYSLNTWRGHIATLPIAAYGQGVLYRKDAFSSLGLTMPDAKDFTWSVYMDLLKKLHGSTVGSQKMFGTVIAGSQPQPIVHMYSQLAASMGVRWFKQFPEGKWDFTPTIDTPENVAALTMYEKLYKLSPPEAINFNWYEAGTRFAHGDIGMFYWWTPYFYLTQSDGYMTGKPSPVADQIAFAALPHDPAHEQTISAGGWSLGIPSFAPNQDNAWTFIKWATSAKGQAAMAKVTKYGHQFSDFARASLYQDADLAKLYPYLPLQLSLLKQSNGKAVRPPAPVYTTLEGIYGLNLNRVLAGNATPEATLKATSDLFLNVLNGNYMIPYQLPSYDDTLANTQALIDKLA